MIRVALMIGALILVVTTHVFVEREIWKWHRRHRKRVRAKGAT